LQLGADLMIRFTFFVPAVNTPDGSGRLDRVKIWRLFSVIRRHLSGAEFFRGISERSLQAAACIRARGPAVLLFREGQGGDSLYILAEGIVQLFKSAEDGREVVLRTLQAGEIFGEVVLFESGLYPASAITLAPSVLLRLTRLQLDCLLAEGEFRADFIAMLMRKQRYLAERILYLTTRDVEDRFFDFLAEQYGRRESYDIPLAKKQVAAAIGTIPETFSRLLLRLKAEGIGSWEGERLSLAPGFWRRRAKVPAWARQAHAE
jgi:CRP/FNR family transcriptional regulator